MEMSAKDLQIEAEKCELEKLQLLEVTKERVSALETLLQDIYDSRHPTLNDYAMRKDLVRCFNAMAKDIYGNSKNTPVVEEFGSFVMDLFSTTSDLDLSINFRTAKATFSREKKIKTLKTFAKKLYYIQDKGHVFGVLPIPQAKVPILKCVDKGTGVECDISVENRDGILKSKMIYNISSIDERFKKLSFLMKNWAKAHNINSSKDKTLNSLSIILLVAFHMQTRNPPILPPFAAIFKDDNTDPEKVMELVPNFLNYGQSNKESVAELFVTLLIKLSSVEKLWAEGLCASVRSASWTSKTWGKSKVAPISVEDFTDQSQNVARAVGQDEVKLIYKCIDISLQHIFSFVDGKIGVDVKDLLFGRDGISTSIPRGFPNLPGNAVLPGQAHHPSEIVTGKQKNQAMLGDSTLTNRIIPVGSFPGTEFESREQVPQATLLESSLTKRIRTSEGRQAMPGGSWAPAPVEAQIVAQHVRSTQQPHARSWDEMRAQDWERSQQTAAEGWAVTRQPYSSGLRVPEQPSGGGWERTQQFGGRGWAGIVQPRAGGWNGWGETQQPRGGGRGGTLQHTARGGGRTSNSFKERGFSSKPM
ncbi:hypothetical protein ACS0TY_005653 [Phlomoides rotata]